MSEVPRPTAGARGDYRARPRPPDPRPSRPADRRAARRQSARPDRRCGRCRTVEPTRAPARLNDPPRKRRAAAAPHGRRPLWMCSNGFAISPTVDAPKTRYVSVALRRPTRFAFPLLVGRAASAARPPRPPFERFRLRQGVLAHRNPVVGLRVAGSNSSRQGGSKRPAGPLPQEQPRITRYGSPGTGDVETQAQFVHGVA